MLEARDVGVPISTIWMDRPSIRRVRQEVGPMVVNGDLDVVIGSSSELSTLVPCSDMHTSACPVALLETGYPSNRFHPAASQPTFGFLGVVSWAQRLLDASNAVFAGTYVRPLPPGHKRA